MYTVYYLYTHDAFEDWDLSGYIVAQSRGQAKSKFVRDMWRAGYDVEWTQPMQIRKMAAFTFEAEAIKHRDELCAKNAR